MSSQLAFQHEVSDQAVSEDGQESKDSGAGEDEGEGAAHSMTGKECDSDNDGNQRCDTKAYRETELGSNMAAK